MPRLSPHIVAWCIWIGKTGSNKQNAVKLSVKSGTALLLSLLLLLTQSGCTYMLWAGEKREPAPTSDLQLYHSAKGNDILVVYREESEFSVSNYPCAYWVNENQIRIDKARSPTFVSRRATNGLCSIPIYCSMPEMAGTNLYALYGTNGLSFTLCSGGLQLSSYRLPVYNSGVNLPEKILLTPVAVSFDAAFVAAYCGLVYLDWKNR